MFINRARLRRRLIVSSALTALALGAPYAAHAATAAGSADASAAPGHQVEQIVVTAERRSTDIQRTALAVTSVPAVTLDQSFVNSVTGLNATVPSLEITKASGFENLVTIRGVGSETPENSLTTVPGVSEFIDGVYIANTISLDQTLFDISSIEVLRGPQGALYGQSSIGGAINIVTNQPRLGKFEGGGDFSAGDYNLFRERAYVNVPLGEQAAARLSFQKYDHDGFTADAAIPGFRLDAAHDVSGKAAVLWKPSEHFSATLTGQWYHSSQAGDAQKNIHDPSTDPRVVNQDYPGHFALDTQLYHLNLAWDLPWFTIKSVTAYQGLQHVQQEDSSRSTFALLGAYDVVAAWNTSVRNFNQELDFISKPGGKLDWIGGLFYLNQTSHQFVAEFGGNTAPTAAQLIVQPDIETNPPGNLNYGNDSHASRESYSVFGQATYHLSSRFRLTAGGRVNWDSYRDPSFNFSAFGTSFVNNSQSDRVATWRVEADYDLTPDNMIYVSAARGYKPGGVNGSYGQQVIPPVFKPETNNSYEIGAKNFLFNRALRLNAAAFFAIHRNFQYIETDPVPFDGGIANIPAIHDYGAEFEASYRALDNRLNITGNLTVETGEVIGPYSTIDSTVANSIENNASYPSPCAFGGAFYNPACWAAVKAAAINIQGKTPPAMPNTAGSISVSYRFDVPGGTLTPRVQLIYRGSEWARVFNDPALDYVKSYTVTNLNLEYAPANSRLKIGLIVTNLFDKAGVNSRYTDPYGTGQTSEQYIPPRQVIGSIAYAF